MVVTECHKFRSQSPHLPGVGLASSDSSEPLPCPHQSCLALPVPHSYTHRAQSRSPLGFSGFLGPFTLGSLSLGHSVPKGQGRTLFSPQNCPQPQLIHGRPMEKKDSFVPVQINRYSTGHKPYQNNDPRPQLQWLTGAHLSVGSG